MLSTLKVALAWRYAHVACRIMPDWKEFRRVVKLYRSKGRHYHTLKHVSDCISFMRETFGYDGQYPVAILALIYHDCIYDVTRKDNEERSAEEFKQYASGKFLDRFVRVGQELILATKSHKPASDRMTQIVLDSDLHILAAEWDKYARYAKGVWKEYRVFGKDGYIKGRTAFLEGARLDIEFSSPEMKSKSRLIRRNFMMELMYLANYTDEFLR